MSGSGNSVLEVRGLTFGYPTRTLFSGLDWSVPPGVSLLTGGEGSGKTTLLRLLAGELMPAKGSIRIGQGMLVDDSTRDRLQVFRTDPRTDELDALTAIECFKRWSGQYAKFNSTLAHELAFHLGLEDHLAKSLYMLSTGSKRKVWLAAAFAAGTALTLLDEPFAALDHRSIHFVLELLQEGTQHPDRSWVVADYSPPEGVALASVLNLGD